MSGYAESWAPADIDQAQYLIDTARDGDEFWAEGARLAAEIAEDAPPMGGGGVVEYGCGVGRIIGQYPHAYPRCGIDVSAEMLDLASQRFARTTRFVQCDGRSLPINSNSAAYIFSVLVLQHMDAADVALVLKDMHRVLRPGGRTWLSFSAFGNTWAPDATLPRGPLKWVGQREGSGSPAHGALRYTDDIIAGLLRDAGFSGGIELRWHPCADEVHHNWVAVAERA